MHATQLNAYNNYLITLTPVCGPSARIADAHRYSTQGKIFLIIKIDATASLSASNTLRLWVPIWHRSRLKHGTRHQDGLKVVKFPDRPVLQLIVQDGDPALGMYIGSKRRAQVHSGRSLRTL